MEPEIEAKNDEPIAKDTGSTGVFTVHLAGLPFRASEVCH
jgi:hypothetical protein